MKPCSRNRKLIAWLALDALDARRAAALRDHLALCPGCRRYWEEISNLVEGLAAGPPDSSLEASRSFHRGVAEKLRAIGSGSVLENLTACLRGRVLAWRAVLPALAVLLVAVLVFVTPRRQPAPARAAPPAVPVVSASGSGSDLAPTLANYQLIASRSLQALDELLTRQGNDRLPPAPIYTASSVQLGNASF